MPVTAVAAEDNILRSNLGEHRDGIGFLTQVSVCGPHEHALWKISQHRFFEVADPVEHSVQFDVVWHDLNLGLTI
jgi:hypothetical protein